MKINLIEFKNFKSYKHLLIDFKDFNVLIGANSAGKSNCIQAITFLKDIVHDGLENAISMQGGTKFLKNLNYNSNDNKMYFRVEFSPDKKFHFNAEKNKKKYKFTINKFEYSFCLEIDDEKETYKIIDDKIIQYYDFYNITNSEKLICSNQFSLTKKAEKFKFKFPPTPQIPFQLNELNRILFIGFEDFTIEKRLLKTSLLKKTILLETPLYFMPHLETLKTDFANIAIYDFDPRTPKQATTIAGKSELLENGENLPLVLKKIFSDIELKRKYLNYLKFLLPYIKNIEIERMLDKYLQIAIQEQYSKEKLIPGFLLSDGTIFILGIITALYFEDKPIVVFEEPERRIHPYLISKIIDMMKDASSNKQIILSTHNPEIVKFAGLENIHYISRDENGFSKIDKITEKKEIKTFLENEIGIEELFIQNLIK
mgnify:CR=1 FL=1